MAPTYLSPLHREMLLVGSGLTEGMITQRGYFTATDPKQLLALGFSTDQAQACPALVVPIWTVDREIGLHQSRPDNPRVVDGKAIKYETPAGAGLRIDVPPGMEMLLGNPNAPLWIGEGVRKGDSFTVRAPADHCFVDLLGVWGFLGRNDLGGITELADWLAIALKGRIVYLAFDNDVVVKPEVRRALMTLAQFLRRKGVKSIRPVQIPGGPEIKGIDDYFTRFPSPSVDHLISAVDYSLLHTESLAAAAVPSHFQWTDIGNCERYVKAFGDDVRYVHLWKRFLSWDGTRWLIDETGGSPATENAKALTKAMLRSSVAISDESDRASYVKYVKTCEGKGKVDAMLGFVRLDPRVVLIPEALDRDPWLLNVLNGTVNLRTGELQPHCRDDLITNLVEIEFDQAAECKEFEEFLMAITCGDPEMVAYLWRVIGYALTGDVSEQKVFFLYGSGSNGKGVFMSVLQKLVGSYGTTIKAETLMLGRSSGEGPTPEVAKLKGARMATAGELPDGRSFDEGQMKWLSGGDRLTASRKHEHPFEFEPTHKLFMSGNHKPNIKNTDEGIWRRFHMVPHDAIFKDQPKGDERQKDTTIGIRLTGELPGILARAARGCLEWQETGLQPPARIVAAVAEYRKESDIIGQFFEEETTEDAECRLRPAELYERFKAWSLAGNERLLTSTKFGLLLKGRSEVVKVEINHAFYYRGRRLRERVGPIELDPEEIAGLPGLSAPPGVVSARI